MPHAQAALDAKARETREDRAPTNHELNYAAHPERRLTSRELRRLLGDVSDMWVWRRLHDDSGFPRPIFIARRRFWRQADVVAWLEAQVETAPAD